LPLPLRYFLHVCHSQRVLCVSMAGMPNVWPVRGFRAAHGSLWEFSNNEHFTYLADSKVLKVPGQRVSFI